MLEITIDTGSGETEIWLFDENLSGWDISQVIHGRGTVTKVVFL